jgi:hypothetical protein
MATARLPVRRRYTKGSIILTSNKSYAEWGSVFGDDVAAAAVIDRLLHSPVGRQKAIRFGRGVWIGDPGRMIDVLRPLVFTLAGGFRSLWGALIASGPGITRQMRAPVRYAAPTKNDWG